MNGRAWRVSVCLAMREHGESEATGDHVTEIANRFFTRQRYPAEPMQAEFELNQFRKHLAFLREASNPPTLDEILEWSSRPKGDVLNNRPLCCDFKELRATLGIRSPYARARRAEAAMEMVT